METQSIVPGPRPPVLFVFGTNTGARRELVNKRFDPIRHDFNVLVEGAADKAILEGAFGLFHKELTRTILVNGSVAETKEGLLVRFYHRAGLPFVVYLDADSRGREIAKSLAQWGITEDKIVQTQAQELFGKDPGQDFELEDVISAEFYHRAVKETYPEYAVDVPPGDFQGKRTRYYEAKFKEAHGIGFNKRRVGETVKKLLLDGNADGETADRLKKVTAKIVNALEAQVKPEVKGGTA